MQETLYQSTKAGKKFVDVMHEQGIVPGIKVDKGLVPLPNSNGESWCMGLDGLAGRCAEYYKAGARFAKWRSVVSIPAGPSIIAVRDLFHRYLHVSLEETACAPDSKRCLFALHCRMAAGRSMAQHPSPSKHPKLEKDKFSQHNR